MAVRFRNNSILIDIRHTVDHVTYCDNNYTKMTITILGNKLITEQAT